MKMLIGFLLGVIVMLFVPISRTFEFVCPAGAAISGSVTTNLAQEWFNPPYVGMEMEDHLCIRHPDTQVSNHAQFARAKKTYPS